MSKPIKGRRLKLAERITAEIPGKDESLRFSNRTQGCCIDYPFEGHWVACPRPVVWSYIELDGTTKLLCEKDAATFMRIRPDFEKPRPDGYGGRLLR